MVRKPISKIRHEYVLFYTSNYEDVCSCDGPDNEGCALSNPLITESEYKNYNLKTGDIFLTPSAAKGEKVLHQYWQVLSSIPEVVCVESGSIDGYVNDFFDEKIIQVRDLSSKDTYVELMPQLTVAMEARTRYCQAVNYTLINEARASNWALIASDSPLLKKK